MKKFLLILTLVILGCSSPVQLIAGTPTPTLSEVEVPTPTATLAPIPTPLTAAELGTDKNPLILALAPSSRNDEDVLTAGETIAAQLESLTGFKIVAVAPTTELELVEDFGKGNAHIAVLSPFGYLLAFENQYVTAALASVRNDQTLYGAQFIVNRDSEFQPFYDEARGENTAEAEDALIQFKDKKPCWSDKASPSGYVVPLGLLNQAKVPVRSGAFLEGQPSVVRAVYNADICDFGATFIDARQSPALEASYSDVLDRVTVIWRIPAIIPYENVSFSRRLPLEMRRVLLRAFVDLMVTPEGKAAMQTVYGIDTLQPADDTLYSEFEKYVKASKLSLEELINTP